MSDCFPRIAIRAGGDPADMAVDALSEGVSMDIRGKRILIKPNIGFLSEPASGVVTHPEVVAGAIRWAQDAGADEILVGDGCIYGVDSAEAFKSSGIQAVVERERAHLVHLDSFDPMTLSIPHPLILNRVKVTSLLKEVDLVMSVPVIKAHMHTGATLSIKNMKGVLHRKEKARMHHLKQKETSGKPGERRTLDCAIADLTSVVIPDIVLLDAVVVMEGMGPLIGDARPLGAVLAGEDALAADLVGLELIGFTLEDAPHIKLVSLKQGRDIRLSGIEYDTELLSRFRTPLRRAIPEDISSAYPYFLLTNSDACSACDGTAMAFLKAYGADYEGKEKVQILIGKGIREEEIRLEHCIVLGNCAAKHKNRGVFLEGCPPIPSDIKKGLEK
jgi:uncharacterized protein (DUF362 family)